MKRYEMIKDKKMFNGIMKHGYYNKNSKFVVYYKEAPSNIFPHFGIAIRNDIGHAVIRNRLKRQTRSIIDNNKNLFKKNKDYIIMIRNECLKNNFKELNDALVKLLKGIEYNEKK